MRHAWVRWLVRATALPIVLVLVWLALSASGAVNRLFIPLPQDVASALGKLFWTGAIWGDLWATVYRMLAGFLIASVAGILCGIVLGHFRPAYLFSELLIDFTRSIPATALFPLFLLFFGVGDRSKIAIVVFPCFFVVLINAIYGVWNAPKTRILMAKSFRASQLQIVSKIIFYDALPQIFAGLRNALSVALILAVVAEMFVGTKNGLGFLIYNAKIAYDTPQMYAVILLLGVLGYTANRGLLWFERRTLHWVRE